MPSPECHRGAARAIWEGVLGVAPLSPGRQLLRPRRHVARRPCASSTRSTITWAWICRSPRSFAPRPCRPGGGDDSPAEGRVPSSCSCARDGRASLFLVHSISGDVLQLRPPHSARDRPACTGSRRSGSTRARPHSPRRGDGRGLRRHLRSVQPAGPYDLAGHSFGGLVAFEMARDPRPRGRASGLARLSTPRRSGVPSPGRPAAVRNGPALPLRGRRASLPPRRLPRYAAEAILLVAPRAPVSPPAPEWPLPPMYRLARSEDGIRRYRPGPFSGGATLFRRQTRAGTCDPLPVCRHGCRARLASSISLAGTWMIAPPMWGPRGAAQRPPRGVRRDRAGGIEPRWSAGPSFLDRSSPRRPPRPATRDANPAGGVAWREMNAGALSSTVTTTRSRGASRPTPRALTRCVSSSCRRAAAPPPRRAIIALTSSGVKRLLAMSSISGIAITRSSSAPSGPSLVTAIRQHPPVLDRLKCTDSPECSLARMGLPLSLRMIRSEAGAQETNRPSASRKAILATR